MTVLRSGSATDVGRVRKVNQDLPLEATNLYAVADGMGGHVGGEVAARVAVDTLLAAFTKEPTSSGLGGSPVLADTVRIVERDDKAAEGDGFLLAVVWRARENRSDLAILDSMNLDAGPVALIKLPTRVRSTFHGAWAPAEALKTGLYDMALVA